jgi:hypothetical protein
MFTRNLFSEIYRFFKMKNHFIKIIAVGFGVFLAGYLSTMSTSILYSRGAQAVQSAQCAMICAAVPCTRARDGTARLVAGEGRAASAIGGEDERTFE